ncbi:MAG: hypothetical protein U9R47_10750, partial [Actinomycetota bacterium]|nr:hypothetical protein [Actinomycetota bacterium]
MTVTFRETEVGQGQTFDFEIIHSYIETLVTIHADQSAGSDLDVILSDLIDNPIGTTIVTAEHGDIESEDNDQLIRTNILDLDAPNGSIGSHTSPSVLRVPINIELIESDFTEVGTPPSDDPKRRMPIGTYTASKVGAGPGFSGLFTREIEITADASDDVVLTVGSDRHAHAPRVALHDFVITFGPVTAGDDIDIFVLASRERTEPSGPGGVHVYRDKHGSATNFGQPAWDRFFRPDCSPVGLTGPCPYAALGVYPAADAPVAGNYLFAASAEHYSQLGDSIDIGDRPTGGTAYLTAGDFVSVRHNTGDHDPAGPVTFTGIVNADSTSTSADGSVILLTNGFINVEERIGNFLVDAIWSSESDVTMWALGSILDEEDDAQTKPDPYGSITPASPDTSLGFDGTDVRGVNITMWAGLPGGGIRGGIGTAGNYLEIDVDVLDGSPLGVLNAFDITSPGEFMGVPNTYGIFIAETDADLQIDTVWTTNDVSMYTIDGSINDARNGGAGDGLWNVRGETIDLDANDYEASPSGYAGPNTNASIGNPNGLNDLEIDSSAYGVENVGLEADR